MQILKDRPGMVVNGKTVFFKEIGDASEGIRRVTKYNKKVNYVDSLGNFICQKDYEDGYRFVNGFARVKENGLWGLINSRGEEVCKCQFEKLRDSHFEYTVACKGTKWFLIRKDGSLLSSQGYDDIILSGSYIQAKQNGKFGFLRQDGKVLVECAYDRILTTTKALQNGRIVNISLTDNK